MCCALTLPRRRVRAGWLGSLLLLVGLIVGAGSFARLFKGSTDKIKVAAGPPLVGIGLVLAVAGSTLLTVAARAGGAARTASPLNSAPQGGKGSFSPSPQQAVYAPGAGPGTLVMMPSPVASAGVGAGTVVMMPGPVASGGVGAGMLAGPAAEPAT